MDFWADFLRFPEDKLKEIEKAKLFLKDYGQEGLRYLDLSVMEAELIQQVGDIESKILGLTIDFSLRGFDADPGDDFGGGDSAADYWG